MSGTMVVPSTKFEIIDQSAITALPSNNPTVPLFLMAAACDKGPEDMRITTSNDFYSLYGSNISFEKYGQPLLQAAAIIEGDAPILFKRVVADDAKLANLAFYGKLTKTQVQKTNDAGAALYKDAVTGEETTVATGNTPIMIDTCTIKYIIKSVQNAKVMSDISNVVEAEIDETNMLYPLFILTDIGRGVSKKKVKISPDYINSKYLGYMKYYLEIIENDTTVEKNYFTFDTDIIEKSENKSIQNAVRLHSNQLSCKGFDSNIQKFISKIAELSGNTQDYCLLNDLLFCKDHGTKDLNNITLDLSSSDAINLSYVYGLQLLNGDNGAFGDTPLPTKEYENQLLNFFNGTFSNDIFDLDKYKLDLVVDANYPESVKRSIEKLVNFRQDFEYFRDLGVGLANTDDIKLANSVSSKDIYSVTYHLSYDIIDPYTRKQITVTVGYSLAKLLISHFKNGRHRPIAGSLHDMILDDAIEGTVNFIPKVTPDYDQKTILLENRVNYASYYDDNLILETFYTSQDDLTELSFANNVLAIQQIVKAVRTKCPAMRYSFLDGDDLVKYKKDVQAILDNYTTNFLKLKLVYLEDPTMTENKIFYAAIQVTFRNFVQAEYFKLYALNADS